MEENWLERELRQATAEFDDLPVSARPVVVPPSAGLFICEECEAEFDSYAEFKAHFHA